MIGLPFITEFFKRVLDRSRGIQGRFVYCPKQGAEINSGDFDQVIKDLFSQDPQPKYYPACFMTPPVSEGKFFNPQGEWEQYRITLFFLTTTFADSYGDTKDPNLSTGTSQHDPMMDQHDMGRCARNFLFVLNQLMRRRTDPSLLKKFQLETSDPSQVLPVAFLGGPNLTGVRLLLRCAVFNGCELEDYDATDILNIAIPEDDPHPEHKL